MRSIRKLEVIEAVGKTGVVGIIRTADVAAGIEMGRGMIDGGVNVLEVSLTFPGSLEIIREIRKQNSGKNFILGAGTVADAPSARMSILEGAEFIVCHCFSEEVVRMCNRYGVACTPGIQTVTEAMKAMELGCDVVKAFPGSVLGPGFIKAVHGPVPYVEVIPVGGVSMDNLGDWFKAGAYAVGLGSALTKENGKEADYEVVLEKSRKTVEKIAAIREGR